jgi:hypothetical protein
VVAAVIPLPGDFELTRISGNAGGLIRLGLWLNGDGFADFEHARIYLGQGMCLDAEPGGAVLSPVGRYDDTGHMWSTGFIPLTPVQRASLVHIGHSYAGTPYSFLDYSALAVKRLGLWAPGLRDYVKATCHMICSQLVARCYLDAGCPLFSGWTGDVTPGDLYQLLRSKGYGSTR